MMIHRDKNINQISVNQNLLYIPEPACPVFEQMQPKPEKKMRSKYQMYVDLKSKTQMSTHA